MRARSLWKPPLCAFLFVSLDASPGNRSRHDTARVVEVQGKLEAIPAREPLSQRGGIASCRFLFSGTGYEKVVSSSPWRFSRTAIEFGSSLTGGRDRIILAGVGRPSRVR